jgi:hypothetical protein
VLERPVLSVGDHTYRWCDVVAFARASGEWDALAATAARRAAAVATEPDGGRVAVDRTVQEAAIAFRRARHLLTADELAVWLERWAMTPAEWLADLRGEVLTAGTGRPPASDPAPAPDHATWVTGVCTGALRSQAGRLALGLAARAGVGGEPVPAGTVGDPSTVAALGADLDRYVATRFSDEQLEIEVHNHRLDWTLVRCDVVVHQREAVLREVAMCVRQDGLPLAAAAARAGLSTSPVWTRIVDVDAGVRGLMAAAGPGDVVGPVGVAGSLLVAQVNDRVEPRPSDPDTRAYARAHAAQRAAAIVVTEHVVWHDR